MFNRILIATGILSALLLTGCSDDRTLLEESESSESIVVTTAVTTSITTTAAETTATTTVTTASTATSSTTSTTMSETHHVEIMNTDFRTRPVPERYYQYSIDTVPDRPRKAIDEGREMLPDIEAWCIDHNNNCVYVCLNYGNEYSGFSDYSFYSIDGQTGEVTFLCDSKPQSDVPNPMPQSEDSYGVYRIGEKLIFGSYNGLYLIDEENHEFVPIVESWNPQSGIAYISKDGEKLIIDSAVRNENNNTIERSIVEYYPRTNTLTKLDDFSNTNEFSFIGDYLFGQNDTEKLSIEGESGEVQKLIFEW